MITRNSLILMDQVQTEIAEGRDPCDAVLDAAIHRAPPVVLKALAALATLALMAACTGCRADEGRAAANDALTAQHASAAPFRPRAVFVQSGRAAEVSAATAGLIWNPGWNLLPAPWSMYLEASVSRWQSRGGYPSDHGTLTQVALIPVLRWRAENGRSPWFFEGGIGAAVTSDVYRRGDTRFSTSFNFADHVGAGYTFGAANEHEVALRFEHFSNAGIKHPNPGENFVELRYARSLD